MASGVESWYADRKVLVTGATGFMGKVLVEKLLRSCPNISAVYILVRYKRGKSPYQRLEDFINCPVFDKIRDMPNYESIFEKIRLICGDVTVPGCSISETDLKLLQRDVSVVFHMAANVRFDQPLKSVLMMNTGGTLNALEVSEQLPELKAFVHVSTSYCHCQETELKEITYKAPHPPLKVLELSSWLDEEILKSMTPKLLNGNPNTYAYTKCLTEQLVTDYSKKIPIAIARPSIVTASWKEPIPGWVENLNGPTGLLVGAGKGVIRSMHCNADYDADILPVDIAINSIILTAYQLGTSKRSEDPLIVNICKGDDNPVSWGEALEMGKKHFYDNPFTICLWYPNGSIKSNYALHLLSVVFLHIIPAYFIDFLFILFRQKPFLVRTQKRIQNGLEVLQYYTTRRWIFHNDRIKKIRESLSPSENETFYTDMNSINWDKYLLDYVLGARKYCVHEEPHTIPRARKILRRLYYLDCIKNLLIICLILWLLWNYSFPFLQSLDNVLRSTVNIIPNKMDV